MDKKVSIIIPNWNGKELLQKCLKSLENSSYSNLEVIVIDNNSSDGSQVFLRENFPLIKLIPLDWNSGFSHAVNTGIRASTGEYIALLNNDTEIDPEWVRNSLKSFELNTEIKIVTSKLINYFERDKIDAAGDEMNIVGQARSRGHGDNVNSWNKGEFVFLATGGATIYKKEVFERVGLLEETYYMYFEDADFSYRCQKKGIKIWFEPSAVVYHMHRASSNKRKDLLEYLLYRNFIIFYLANTPTNLFFVRLSLLKFILVAIHTYYYLSKNGKIAPATKSLIWIFTHFQTIIKLRQERNVLLETSTEYIDSWRVDKKISILGLKF